MQWNLHVVIVPSVPPLPMLHFVDAPTVVNLTDVDEDH
jgi:hypothetical protein